MKNLFLSIKPTKKNIIIGLTAIFVFVSINLYVLLDNFRAFQVTLPKISFISFDEEKEIVYQITKSNPESLQHYKGNSDYSEKYTFTVTDNFLRKYQITVKLIEKGYFNNVEHYYTMNINCKHDEPLSDFRQDSAKEVFEYAKHVYNWKRKR